MRVFIIEIQNMIFYNHWVLFYSFRENRVHKRKQKLFETIETDKTSYKKRNCLFVTKGKRLWKFYADFSQDANYSYRDQINSYVRFANNRKLAISILRF